MFITTPLSPAEVIAELIKGRRLSIEATKQFAALKHDRDLVPHITSHVHDILDHYRAYRNEAHDIQSLRDDGIDILITFDKNNEEHRTGIQVKSNDEFRQWKRKKLNLVEKLKAQYAVAMQNGKLNDYYIILCADDEEYRTQIRMICSELKNFRNCSIVEPIDAIGFYNFSSFDLSVRTTRLLCGEDPLLSIARDEIESIEPAEAYALIQIMDLAFDSSFNITDDTLFNIFSDWSEILNTNDPPDIPFDRHTEQLIGRGILGQNGFSYDINIRNFPKGLCALYFDLKARSLPIFDSPCPYMVELLDIPTSIDEQ